MGRLSEGITPQEREGGLGDGDGADEVDFKLASPVVEGDGLDGPWDGDAGVVDEGEEAARFALDERDGAGDRGRVGDIEGERADGRRRELGGPRVRVGVTSGGPDVEAT